MPLLKCSTSASDSDLPVIPLIRKKVVVVGDAESGKTCLLHRFAKNARPSVYVSTVYEHYTVDKDGVRLSLWDTAGKDNICSNLRPMYYPETDIVILCFDISSRDSLKNVKNRWMPELKHFCPGVPIVLVGNKTDKRTSKSNKRDSKAFEELKHKVDVKDNGVVDVKDDGGADVKKIDAVEFKENDPKDFIENGGLISTEEGLVNVKDNGLVEKNFDGGTNVKNDGEVDSKGGVEVDINTDTDEVANVNGGVNVKVDVGMDVTNDRDLDDNHENNDGNFQENIGLGYEQLIQNKNRSGEKVSQEETESSDNIHKIPTPTNQDIIDAFFQEGQLYRETLPAEMTSRRVTSILKRGLSMSKDGWGDENENESDQKREVILKKIEEPILEEGKEFEHGKARKVSSIVRKGLLMTKEGWTDQQADIQEDEERKSDNIEETETTKPIIYSSHDIVEDVIDMALNTFIRVSENMETSSENDDQGKKDDDTEIKCNQELISATLVSQVLKQQNKEKTTDDHECLQRNETGCNHHSQSVKLVNQVLKQQNSLVNQSKKDETESSEVNRDDSIEIHEDANVTEDLNGVKHVETDENGIENLKNTDDLNSKDTIQYSIENMSITETQESENNTKKLEKDQSFMVENTFMDNRYDISSENTESLDGLEKSERYNSNNSTIQKENVGFSSKISINNEQTPVTELNKVGLNQQMNKLISQESGIYKRNKQTVTSKPPNIFQKFRASLQIDDSLVQIEEGKRMAKQIGAIAYLECSARKVKNSGISEVFDIAIKSEKRKNKRMQNNCKCTIL